MNTIANFGANCASGFIFDVKIWLAVSGMILRVVFLDDKLELLCRLVGSDTELVFDCQNSTDSLRLRGLVTVTWVLLLRC